MGDLFKVDVMGLKDNKATWILLILPIGYLIDLFIDGCVADVLDAGATICGAAAEGHALFAVGTFTLLFVVLAYVMKK